VNVAMQRTPSGPVQSTARAVSDTISTGARRIIGSGTKLMRRSKNQGTDATVQQDNVSTAVQQVDASTAVQQIDASTVVIALSTNVPDGSNAGTNTTQEHGDMGPDTSLLSELGA